MQRVRPLICFALIASTLTLVASAEETQRTLFDFSGPNASAQWQIVNDGVMGGRSTSRAIISENGQMTFSGNLSLQNNGGFASVRSRPSSLALNSADVIVLRVKGDGRRYTFNLYVPNRRTAFSHRSEFATVAGQWTEVRLPLNRFAATSFGRPVRDVLVPSQVSSLGILLGDKNPGQFEIAIDSIKVASRSR